MPYRKRGKCKIPGVPEPPVLDQTVLDTRHGPGRVLRSCADEPWATLALGHGAGGGAHARDLGWLASDLPSEGISVLRFEQPWRVAGRKAASRSAVLDESWLDMLASLPRDSPIIVGGRSSGARVACRTAGAVGAVGCLALAFPLRPPWKPEQTRLAELQSCSVPTLIVQGDRDAFGTALDFPELPPGTRLESLADADHEFAVRTGFGQTAASTRTNLVGNVLTWSRQIAGDA